MRKTLYLKFIVAYLIFGFFGFVVVATFVSNMTLDHVKKERSEALYKEATQIANTYAMDLYRNQTSLDTVQNQLGSLAAFTDSIIWIINQTNYSVMYMGHPVEMPPKELELLYFLASSPNHVFTREQLLDQIWGYEYIGDTRTVDVHIKRLREKISDHESWKISTIWGIGYKFEVK